MGQIIFDQKSEGYRGLSADGAWHRHFTGWNLSDNMRQMKIVQSPKRQHLSPIGAVVTLKVHPLLLRIGREGKFGRALCPYEPLMIIGGRIDEMPQNLLLGPSFW